MDEDILDEITPSVIQSDTSLLANVVAPPLGQLRNLWWRQRVWGFQEATSDEMFFPVRGTDWYDGGVWTQDYLHTWTPMHRDVIDTWNDLSTSLLACNIAYVNIGDPKPGEAQKFTDYRSQVVFLRAFYEYCMYDLYRTFPYRSPSESDYTKAPKIYKGTQGFNHIVTEMLNILPTMTERKKAIYGNPNKDAGLMLLAKLYLNKEVYTGVSGYDSCLLFLNQLINSGNYGLANNYFKIFSVDNDNNYLKPDDEAIFVSVMGDDQDYGNDDNVQWVKTTFHYYQDLGSTFAPWNGNCTTEGYLTSNWFNGTDTAKDARWADSSVYADMGIVLGFNYGQQYMAKTHEIIKDRNGNPLNFTFSVPLNGAKEYEGVRVLKYPPRVVPVNVARTPNDFIIWRYADALLMQAECIARTGGSPAEALAIVNQIRTKRNAPVVSASTADEVLNKIYIERGLELYWEGHRRQDMIRFGTFLQPKDSKPEVSPDRAVILPIPQSAITGTPGGVLQQNPGY
jgi:hypothetical protein